MNLKKIRKERGMTGAKLGEKAKISISTLSMIETGRRRPSVNLAKRLGLALGVDWTLFFEESGGNETEDAKKP